MTLSTLKKFRYTPFSETRLKLILWELSMRYSIKAPLLRDNSVYPMTSKVLEFLKTLHLAERLLSVLMWQYKKQQCTQQSKTALGTINHADRYRSRFGNTLQAVLWQNSLQRCFPMARIKMHVFKWSQYRWKRQNILY